MQPILDPELCSILGRPTCEDECVVRTLAGIVFAAIAVTLSLVGFAGALASHHLGAETARRWSKGEVFGVELPLLVRGSP